MSRGSIDSRASRRWCSINAINALSNDNFDNLHNMVSMRNSYSTSTGISKHCNNHHGHGNGYSRPISHSKFPYKHIKRTHKFDVIKHSQLKGLIFVWPQKRNFYYEREYSVAIRLLAQLLYWLNEMRIFPSGSGMPIKKPPWLIKQPIPKPESRDYIIEPDWNSVYYDM